MLTIDAEKAQKYAQTLKIEAEQQKVADWAALEEQNAQFLADPSTDTTWIPARIGRMLTTAEFERKLAKILPSAVFIWDVYSEIKKKKLLIVPDATGNIKFSLVYESDFLPERSIMSRSYAETVDPRYLIDPASFHISRADLPKHEYIPGIGFQFDKSQPLPGMKRTEIPWREEKRGWRTVLLRLIKEGYITPSQAEKEFYGADATPEWQGNLGRTTHTRPW